MPKILEIKVTLKGVSKPPVWRKFEIQDTHSLDDLHHFIQKAMGWYNVHLYAFELGEDFYSLPDLDEAIDSRKTKVTRLLSAPGKSILYEYDFGDSWDHKVELAKVFDPVPGVSYPRLTGGKGACPPEDCGGVWGYENLKKIIADPEHEEYEEWSEWVGDDFDPNEFDLAKQQTRF